MASTADFARDPAELEEKKQQKIIAEHGERLHPKDFQGEHGTLGDFINDFN